MSSRSFAPWLWLLFATFCGRVLAQLLQWQIGVSFLPPFEDWQSGALPYGALLTAQILIILVLAKIAWNFSTQNLAPSRRRARVWLICGITYLGSMVARLALGLTILDGHAWFDKPLPTLFHFVLSTFVILVGLYHSLNSRAT